MDARLRTTAERALERALGHQRWRVDGEKVIATFAFGGSLAINATAWEAGATTYALTWTCVALSVLALVSGSLAMLTLPG